MSAQKKEKFSVLSSALIESAYVTSDSEKWENCKSYAVVFISESLDEAAQYCVRLNEQYAAKYNK
tara:strand:- start:1217 stop:1411 length:195 start_codon:yes stop_codon:yes gene_type:complete